MRSSRNRRKDNIRYLKKVHTLKTNQDSIIYLKKVHTLKTNQLVKPAKKVLNLKVARKQMPIENKKQMSTRTRAKYSI